MDSGRGRKRKMEELQPRRKNFNGLQTIVPNIEERGLQVRELQRKESNVQIPMEEASEG